MTGREYACKVINAVKKSTQQAVKDEVDIMNQLHHPKLLQANDAFSKGKNMAIVTELWVQITDTFFKVNNQVVVSRY